MGKCIAIANQKGGVGKTTTSVNLSSCLAQLGKKVLLIDTDPQGNATSGVGTERENLEKSVYDVIINAEKISDVIVKTDHGKLYICPSSIDLAGAEIELVSASKRETRLKDAVAQIKDDYDFIIIDCPPSLGLITLNSFVCADSIIIPIQCEYYALEGLSQLTNTIRMVKQQMNRNLDLEGIVLTMYDTRTNLSVQVADEVKKYYGTKLYKSVIPRNVRLSEAPSYGLPINIYDSTSKGCDSYMSLAREVIKANK